MNTQKRIPDDVVALAKPLIRRLYKEPAFHCSKEWSQAAAELFAFFLDRKYRTHVEELIAEAKCEQET